ncbi:MAG: hypothetical protein RSC38_05250 [Oscillospiraceae bacterium]
MSSFIMSAKSLSILANTLEKVLNMGFNRFGFDAQSNLKEVLSDCCDDYKFYSDEKIFFRLSLLNATAVSARYHDENADAPDFSDALSIVAERDFKAGHEIILPWHFQFCKLLDCFLYQCDEVYAREDELFLALSAFSQDYKSFIVSNSAEYCSFPWG